MQDISRIRNKRINIGICIMCVFGIIFCTTKLFAFESNEEIDNLDQKKYLQELVKNADKTCRSNFKDDVERTYENLEMLEYPRKDCFSLGEVLIDSSNECPDVLYKCDKPSQSAIDSEFVKLKDKFKAKLASDNDKKAKKAECDSIQAKVADGGEFENLKELAKLYRKECK